MSNNTHNPTPLEMLRHSAAHLLAAAVLELYPDAKPTIGPAIENGFYYDFEFPTPISENDLPKIEKRMRKIITTWEDFQRTDVTKEEALEKFADNPYKQELISEFSTEDQQLTFYTSGNFTDLCRGGHVESPKSELKHFKLLSLAGAYWRGDENNTMLTRIYGTAFPSQEELDAYLAMLEEAKKRDHRKIGKELDLFTFSPLVGAGLPLFTPKGTIIRSELQQSLMQISKKYDAQETTIPHIAKRALYETSGHADKFGDELLTVTSKYDEFVMKPVNCPHHTQIYASKPRSYRDLPLRYVETTMQYRDEKPGEIGGLTRVRSITLDDGHTFCRPDQIIDEARRIAKVVEEFYQGLGMWGTHWVSLSVRNPETPDAYIGTPEDWDAAETMLHELSEELSLNAKRMEGEAALYGPKLDYMFKDAMGNERQLATIQIDFSMPKRFELEYADSDGTKKTPVMLHRAILGSYERFMALLIEHFAGAFPVWLAPVQVKLLPVGEGHREFAQTLADTFKTHDIRAEVDMSDESVGKKIRTAAKEKVPYILVLGDKEMESDTLTIRKRGSEDQIEVNKQAFVDQVLQEINEKVLS